MRRRNAREAAGQRWQWRARRARLAELGISHSRFLVLLTRWSDPRDANAPSYRARVVRGSLPHRNASQPRVPPTGPAFTSSHPAAGAAATKRVSERCSPRLRVTRARDGTPRRQSTLRPLIDGRRARISAEDRDPTSRPPTARARGTGRRAARLPRPAAGRGARRSPRVAAGNLAQHPTGAMEHGRQHQPDGQGSRDRPPAAGAEDASQPRRMPRREQALEELLRDVDHNEARRADQPQRDERRSCSAGASDDRPTRGPARKGSRRARSRSAARSTAPANAGTSDPAPATPARPDCQMPASSAAGAPRTRLPASARPNPPAGARTPRWKRANIAAGRYPRRGEARRAAGRGSGFGSAGR